jgi:hypothetical protein
MCSPGTSGAMPVDGSVTTTAPAWIASSASPVKAGGAVSMKVDENLGLCQQRPAALWEKRRSVPRARSAGRDLQQAVVTREDTRCVAQMLRSPRALCAQEHHVDWPCGLGIEAVEGLRVPRPDEPRADPQSVHGDRRSLVENEHCASSPEQGNSLIVVPLRWRLVAQKDRSPKDRL